MFVTDESQLAARERYMKDAAGRFRLVGELSTNDEDYDVYGTAEMDGVVYNVRFILVADWHFSDASEDALGVRAIGIYSTRLF
jgi:hypothetical protein